MIEGIISLFIGIFKQILKVVKEGILVLMRSCSILFGKASRSMSPAEKGDAIIKILGGSVIAICGIGIEALLNKIGIMEPWSVILSTMLSGIASTLFMLVLDRIDLFSVKAERRYQRVEEIFDERIQDIRAAEQTLGLVAMETMRRQRLQFMKIEQNISDGIRSNKIETINSGLFELASFFGADLGYANQSEFVRKFDDMEIAL